MADSREADATLVNDPLGEPEEPSEQDAEDPPTRVVQRTPSAGGARRQADDQPPPSPGPPRAAPSPTPPEGLPAAKNRYRLVSELARGGNGRIVRAVDGELRREVAMKLLLPGFVKSRDAYARFLSEARITARLDHPNVVPVHDIGQLPSGEPFFVMKLVRGRSLSQILAGLRRQDPETTREFSRLRLLQIFQRLCMGVAYAHSKAVIHRDLKPANVMVGEFGEVHVMDWGLAKARGRTESGSYEIARDPLNDDPQTSMEGRVFGTPLYMSPEQALGRLQEIDERSDIYSLGALLYELLTYQPPFPSRGIDEVLLAVINDPVTPPRQRAPERDVPEVLEEICLKALSKNKADRYASARELHDEIEAFLEGTKERERKEREAKAKVEEGLERLRDYHDIQGSIAALTKKRDELRQKIPRYAPEDEKQLLWELERRLAEARGDDLRAFGMAIDAFQQALGFVQDHPEARQHLADLYAQRLRQAEAEKNPERANHYATQVRRYDDGRYARLLEGVAFLRVSTTPPGARLFLQPIESREVVARLGPQSTLGQSPLESSLKFGDYLLEIEAPGFARTSVPLSLGRNESLEIDIPLLRPSQIPEGFVYIPEGPAWVGGDPLAPSSGPWRRVQVPGFLMARFPVLMGEYLEFLNALVERDPEEAQRRVPRATVNSGYYWHRGPDGRYALPGEDPDGDVHHPRFPVVAVSYEDAVAYCAWRSARDGVRYRLPTDVEWEKAGRGADGRFFPWGDLFDPAFCKMRDSRPKRVMELAGIFWRDESPYGVRDLAGSVAEFCDGWFDEEAGLRSVKGGAWTLPEQNCRLAARSGERPHVVSGARGFRLAADL